MGEHRTERTSDRRLSEALRPAGATVDSLSNRNVWAEWIGRHSSLVRATLVRWGADAASVDDLSQEVFYRFWRMRTRTRIRPDGNLVALLLGIARNVWREHCAVSARGQTQPTALVESAGDPGQALDRRERVRILLAAVARLPARQRQALELIHLAGLSVRQTAEVMDCTQGAVRAYLVNARRYLLQQFRDGYG